MWERSLAQIPQEKEGTVQKSTSKKSTSFGTSKTTSTRKRFSSRHPLHRDETFAAFAGQKVNPLHVHFDSDVPNARPSLDTYRGRKLWESSLAQIPQEKEGTIQKSTSKKSTSFTSTRKHFSSRHPLHRDETFAAFAGQKVNPLHVHFDSDVPNAKPTLDTSRGRQMWERSYAQNPQEKEGTVQKQEQWLAAFAKSQRPTDIHRLRPRHPLHHDDVLRRVSGVAGTGAAFNPLHVHYDPYASSAQATPSYKGRSYYDKSVGMYEKSQTFQQKQQFGRQQQQLKSVGKVSRTNPLHKDDTFRDLARASGVGAVGLTYFNPLHVHYDPYALNARPSAPTSRAREIYQKSVGVFDKQGGFAALNAGVAVGTVGRGVTMAPGVAMDRLSQSRRDAVEGMRNIATGTIPSNTQLDAIIQKTIKGLDEEIVASKLRPHSKRAVADARELLLDLRQFIHEKNEDEKFQRFFTASRTQAQAVAAGGKSMSQESRPVLMQKY